MTVADMRGEFLESRSGDGRCPVFRDALTALDGNQHQPIEIAPTPSTLRAAWGWGRRCRGVELPAHRGGSSRPSRSSLPGPRAAWTSYQRGNCHRALTDDGTESSRSGGPSAIRWRRSTSLPAKPNGSTCTLSVNVRSAMTAAPGPPPAVASRPRTHVRTTRPAAASVGQWVARCASSTMRTFARARWRRTR